MMVSGHIDLPDEMDDSFVSAIFWNETLKRLFRLP